MSYFSQGFVINAILLLFIFFLFILDTIRKKKYSHFLLFLFGNCALSLYYLLGTLSFSDDYQWHAILTLPFFIGLTALIAYLYETPHSIRVREKRVAIALSFTGYLFILNEIINNKSEYNFQIHSYNQNLPITYTIVMLHLIWGVRISLRQIFPSKSLKDFLKELFTNPRKINLKLLQSFGQVRIISVLLPILVASLLIPIVYFIYIFDFIDIKAFYFFLQNYYLLLNIALLYILFSYGKQASNYLIKTTGYALISIIAASQIMTVFFLDRTNLLYAHEAKRELPVVIENYHNKNFLGIPIDVEYIIEHNLVKNKQDLFLRNNALRPELRNITFHDLDKKPDLNFRKINNRYFISFYYTQADTIYEIGYPYKIYRNAYHENAFPLTILLLGIVSFTLFIFPFIIRKGVLKPIKNMTKAFSQIRGGFFDHALEVVHHDEIGLMTARFNRMSHFIKKAEDRLRTYTENLEKTVETRSHELKEKVRLLQTLNDELGKRISEKNRIAEDLRNSKRFLSQITAASPQLLFLYDIQNNSLLFVNKDCSGQCKESPFPNCLGQDVLEEDLEALEKWLMDIRDSKKISISEIEYRTRLHSGKTVWMHTRISVFTRTSQKHPLQVTGTSIDITERKLAQEKILFLAHHDALTNLPNRTRLKSYFQESLDHGISNMAILFLDLDRFRWVNENLGHESGDMLLVSLSAELRRILEPGDILARWGGDEFVMILRSEENLEERSALVAGQILKNMREPFILSGREVFVSGSIGITLYPKYGKKLSQLMRQADMAMFTAKDAGRDRYAFFDKEIENRSSGKVDMEREIRFAIENREFVVLYQPKVNMKNRQLSGVEALVRWNRGKKEMVPPAQFLTLAEETGLIMGISDLVFEEAFLQVQKWKAKNIHLPISLNLSNRQLHEKNLCQNIINLMNHYNVTIEDIELELTENIIFNQSKVVLENLNDLKNQGFILSLDDFGTGYSSLNSIRNLPIAKLKIDQSFVADIMYKEKEALQLVSAIVAFASKLNIKLIAEGVEDETQIEFLAEQGVDEAQGYYFGKPMLPAEIETFFDSNEAGIKV